MPRSRILVIAILLLAPFVVAPQRTEAQVPCPRTSDPGPSGTIICTVTVPATTPDETLIDLPRGSYRLAASGTYTFFIDGRQADAECSIDPDGVWRRYQYSLGPVNDLLDLQVQRQDVEWQAPSGQLDCDPATHRYTYDISWSGGLLGLRIFDAGYGDNAASLTVDVVQLPPTQPLFTFVVPANSPDGIETPRLTAGLAYRFVASRSYDYHQPGDGFVADAECSVTPFDTTPRADRYVSGADDVLDLYLDDGFPNGVADGPVAWVPLVPTPDGLCANDVMRTYETRFTAQNNAAVRAFVKDGGYLDNAGALVLQVFQEPVALQAPDPSEPPPPPDVDDDLPLPGQDSGTLVKQVFVPATSSGGVDVPLQAGTYRLRARGTYVFAGAFRADAECSFLGDRWQRHRFGAGPVNDLLDLQANRADLEWTAETGTTGPIDCDPENHAYFAEVSWGGGALNLRILDAGYQDNADGITVDILKLDRPQLVAAIAVPANDPAGVLTPPLFTGVTYRFVVTGTYQYFPGFEADAECSVTPSDPARDVNRYPTPDEDLLDLYLDDGATNGTADGPVAWRPAAGATADGLCAADPNRTYDTTIVPKIDAPVRAFIKDVSYIDNASGLLLRIFRTPIVLTAPDPSAPLPDVGAIVADVAQLLPQPPIGLPEEESTFIQSVQVDASSADGTTVFLDPGTYLLRASGTYQFAGPGFIADPECSLVGGSWARYRFGAGPANDVLDLRVNELDTEWRAENGATGPVECDTVGHTYTVEFSHLGGPVKLSVLDTSFGDNAGLIDVDIVRISREILIATVAVPGNSAQGVTVRALPAGGSLRFVASRTYDYHEPGDGFTADAECSQTRSDPTPRHARFLSGTDDLLDLYLDDGSPNGVADGPVTWAPIEPTADGFCAADVDRTYQVSFTPLEDSIRAFVKDSEYADNFRAIILQVFQG